MVYYFPTIACWLMSISFESMIPFSYESIFTVVAFFFRTALIFIPLSFNMTNLLQLLEERETNSIGNDHSIDVLLRFLLQASSGDQ